MDYSDGDECVNMTVYVNLSLPLLQRSDPVLLWSRFLRSALYFAYATSAPQQRAKRALLLQVIYPCDHSYIYIYIYICFNSSLPSRQPVVLVLGLKHWLQACHPSHPRTPTLALIRMSSSFWAQTSCPQKNWLK
jgi:hypothetical protein